MTKIISKKLIKYVGEQLMKCPCTGFVADISTFFRVFLLQHVDVVKSDSFEWDIQQWESDVNSWRVLW